MVVGIWLQVPQGVILNVQPCKMHYGNRATWKYFYTTSTHIVLIIEWNSDALKHKLVLIIDAEKSKKNTDIFGKKNNKKTKLKQQRR